jgi:hypothetical protein
VQLNNKGKCFSSTEPLARGEENSILKAKDLLAMTVLIVKAIDGKEN